MTLNFFRTGDLRYRKMLHKESVSEVLKHVGEDNITCAMTCEFDKNKHVYKDMDPNETIHKRLETLITKSKICCQNFYFIFYRFIHFVFFL